MGGNLMSETRWTPGPWVALNRGTVSEPMMFVMAARIAGQPPRHEVAVCATGDSPQWMENANASLIAAAPDLYAALLEARPTVRNGRDDPNAQPWQKETRDGILNRMDAALAKARGEAP